MKESVVAPVAKYLVGLIALLSAAGCGADASTDDTYPRSPLSANRNVSADTSSLVAHLESLIDEDPLAQGRVLAFDLSPYRNETEGKARLFATLRGQLENLPEAQLSNSQLQSRSQSVERLLQSMRRGWDLQRRTLERESEHPVSDAEVLAAFFGGGTAFPVPYTREQRDAAYAEPTELVASHPLPQSDGYVCVVFVDTSQRLGTEVENTLPFALQPQFIEELDALDGGIAGSLIATHELSHCLHSKSVPREFTGVMALRHTETVADIVAYLRSPLATEPLEPSALEDFRIVSSGLQVRRGRNTARGIALARHHLNALPATDALEIRSKTISELSELADQFSRTALQEDFPIWESLLPEDQHDENRRVGVSRKRLLRFATESLEGTVDHQQWVDEWSGQFGATEAALLLRLQRTAERVLVAGQTEPLGAALRTCESQWPSSFAAARLRLKHQSGEP